MSERALPNIDLTKANLLFSKQASGLYVPVWQAGTDDGEALVSVAGGSLGGAITPSSASGNNVEVASATSMVIDTMLTGATRVRCIVASITGSPGNLYVHFGADETEANGNVNATTGLGVLALVAAAAGDEFELTIPEPARDGGKLSAGISGYSVGVNELVLNISQGV